MTEKRVDKSWKEEARREKEKLQKRKKAEEELENKRRQIQYPPPSFTTLVTTLASEAYTALGLQEDPRAQKAPKNLPQAQFLIGFLEVLKDKTAGNLSEQEAALLQQLLTDLHLKFVDAKKEENK